MEPSQIIPIYVPSMNFIDWQSCVIISVVRVSLPCYFSSCDYVLLYRLILENNKFAVYLLVRAIKVATYLQKTWEPALRARGSSLSSSYLSAPSPHTPVVHYKSFQILHSKLSEGHHHLASCEGQQKANIAKRWHFCIWTRCTDSWKSGTEKMLTFLS